jgi:hypothetical protein
VQKLNLAHSTSSLLAALLSDLVRLPQDAIRRDALEQPWIFTLNLGDDLRGTIKVFSAISSRCLGATRPAKAQIRRIRLTTINPPLRFAP